MPTHPPYPHQVVDQVTVAGQQLWVETWSWSYWVSPLLPWFYTTVGGEVNIWMDKPPERKEVPVWLRYVCSIWFINLFCLLATVIKGRGLRGRLWTGDDVSIQLMNTYYDEADGVCDNINKTCNKVSKCVHAHHTNSFGLIQMPQIGGTSNPVVAVRTEAYITLNSHTFHHITEKRISPIP